MSKRKFVDMIQRAAERHGIDMSVLSDEWIIELRRGDARRRIVGQNFDINTQAAAEIARDKVATSAVLNEYRIAHVPHVLLQSNAEFLESILNDMKLRSDSLVLKPLDGAGGALVSRIGSARDIERKMQEYPLVRWAASPWIDVEKEIRLVVVDGVVRLAYEKTDPVMIDDLKFFNLNKGAKATALNVAMIDRRFEALAVSAVRCLGLRTAAVDAIVTTTGDVCVLEVNAAFSLMKYAQVSSATDDEVALFYEQLVAELFRQSS